VDHHVEGPPWVLHQEESLGEETHRVRQEAWGRVREGHPAGDVHQAFALGRGKVGRAAAPSGAAEDLDVLHLVGRLNRGHGEQLGQVFPLAQGARRLAWRLVAEDFSRQL